MESPDRLSEYCDRLYDNVIRNNVSLRDCSEIKERLCKVLKHWRWARLVRHLNAIDNIKLLSSIARPYDFHSYSIRAFIQLVPSGNACARAHVYESVLRGVSNDRVVYSGRAIFQISVRHVYWLYRQFVSASFPHVYRVYREKDKVLRISRIHNRRSILASAFSAAKVDKAGGTNKRQASKLWALENGGIFYTRIQTVYKSRREGIIAFRHRQ